MRKINKKIINDALWVLYEDWILNKINLGKGTDFRKRYSKLLMDLHFIEFTYIIDKDKNRAEDGLYLRNDFLEYDQPETISMSNPCSVLEMLASLSLRIETEYIGDPKKSSPEEHFINMLYNLDLLIYENYCYNLSNIKKNIQIWLDRNFDYDGNGSIFPLVHTSIYDLSGIFRGKKYPDQRKIEIWEQMMCYINDQYNI